MEGIKSKWNEVAVQETREGKEKEGNGREVISSEMERSRM